MSAVKKRSVAINGHRTSYSIEDAFQTALDDIARGKNISVAALIAQVDLLPRTDCGLSSALRVFVLNHALGKITQG